MNRHTALVILAVVLGLLDLGGLLLFHADIQTVWGLALASLVSFEAASLP
jgi:hypothetical protein